MVQIVTDPAALQRLTLDWKKQGLCVGFVPTMGYLHEGHQSLLRAAREQADRVVVSVFVNPTQFGPNEDYATYPRDEARDLRVIEEAGADVLFRPDPSSMYDPDAATWVEVPSLAQTLCAVSRPTHFRGVCTVVTKLFHLANPDIAFFGEKDWQQLAILRRMVADLMFPLKIVGCPIVREADGLAKSSRNVHLSPDERAQAVHIHKALAVAKEMVQKGERQVAVILSAVRAVMERDMPLGVVDYLEAVDPARMAAVEVIDRDVLFAAAVKFSKVRLIDNILIQSDRR